MSAVRTDTLRVKKQHGSVKTNKRFGRNDALRHEGDE